MKYRMILVYFIIALLNFIVGGTVATWIIKSQIFKFDNEINVTDLLTLILTILLALFVTFYVEKTKEIKRGTKDLFISYYKDYRSNLEIKMIPIQKNELNNVKKSAVLKLLRTQVHELNNITVSRNLVKKDNSLIRELNQAIKDLWTESTREIVINDAGLVNIELILLKIESLINKIIIEINEA